MHLARCVGLGQVGVTIFVVMVALMIDSLVGGIDDHSDLKIKKPRLALPGLR